jgi:hypothetical protein
MFVARDWVIRRSVRRSWRVCIVAVIVSKIQETPRGNVRFGRLEWPKLDARVYSKESPMAMKAILARVIKDKPSSLSVAAMDFAGPANSSGESSLVKASLKVMDAVARVVAIAPAASCGNRENPLVVRDWIFHRYVSATSVQSVSRWEEKKVRAISGSPANFCPV